MSLEFWRGSLYKIESIVALKPLGIIKTKTMIKGILRIAVVLFSLLLTSCIDSNMKGKVSGGSDSENIFVVEYSLKDNKHLKDGLNEYSLKDIIDLGEEKDSVTIGDIVIKAQGMQYISPEEYLKDIEMETEISPRDNLVKDRLKGVFVDTIQHLYSATEMRTFVYLVEPALGVPFKSDYISFWIRQDIEKYHARMWKERSGAIVLSNATIYWNSLKTEEGKREICVSAIMIINGRIYVIVQTGTMLEDAYKSFDYSRRGYRILEKFLKRISAKNKETFVTDHKRRSFERLLKNPTPKIIEAENLAYHFNVPADLKLRKPYYGQLQDPLYSKDFGFDLDFVVRGIASIIEPGELIPAVQIDEIIPINDDAEVLVDSQENKDTYLREVLYSMRELRHREGRWEYEKIKRGDKIFYRLIEGGVVRYTFTYYTYTNECILKYTIIKSWPENNFTREVIIEKTDNIVAEISSDIPSPITE